MLPVDSVSPSEPKEEIKSLPLATSSGEEDVETNNEVSSGSENRTFKTTESSSEESKDTSTDSLASSLSVSDNVTSPEIVLDLLQPKVNYSQKWMTKVTDVASKSLYYRKLSWLTFGAETPILTGGCYLANSYVVITDYNNQRLLLFDDEYEFTASFKLDGWPSDIANTTTDLEIYVVLCDKALVRYKVDIENSELICLSHSKLPKDSRYISTVGDEIILSSINSIYIMFSPDRVFLEIPKQGGHAHVTMSNNYKRFVHKDGDSIICRTLHGEEVFRYSNAKLKRPRGLCQDSDDITYVCGHDSGIIYQISSDGSKGRVMVRSLHQIRKPNAVMFDTKRNHILITSWGENTAFEVYQINS